jgi:hypothetical protein
MDPYKAREQIQEMDMTFSRNIQGNYEFRDEAGIRNLIVDLQKKPLNLIWSNENNL